MVVYVDPLGWGLQDHEGDAHIRDPAQGFELRILREGTRASKRLQDSSHVSYSLNSLKGGYIGDYIGDYYSGY